MDTISESNCLDKPVEKSLTLGNPPEEEWNKTLSIPGWGNCVQETPDDCYIIAGTCGIGYWWDAFLLKTDNQGNELWNKTYGSYWPKSSYDFGKWVEVTDDGGYILVGYKDQSEYPTSNLDIWLLKTDSNGNEEWNSTFDGDENDKGFSVKQTEEGGYIVTGEYYYKICLLKVDENGNEEWKRIYSYGQGNSIEQTDDGGYILTGVIPNDCMIIIKTDEDGNKIWQKILPEEQHGYSSGMRVQQTIDSGYIIGGYTNFYGAGRDDYWLVKLDTNGNEQWNKTYGSSEYEDGYSAIQTIDGGYILGGVKYNEKFWIVRTNANGEVIWDKVYIPSIFARCLCIQQTKDDGYIATGIWDWTNENGCVLVKIGPDLQNHPPSAPKIDGQKNGRVRIEYEYTFNSTDDDGDDIIYFVNWDDGSPIEIVVPTSPSGTEAKASHKWDKKGTYSIRARTGDAFGAYSEWSDYYPVTMPRNKKSYNLLFVWFYNRFSNTYPIFR